MSTKLSLAKCAATPPKNVFLVNAPIDCVNVLQQMRGKMSEEGIDELVMSIKSVGQMSPGIVVALPAKAAKLYLKRINEMWGISYKLSQFKSVYLEELAAECYLFVVAGHRRRLAVVKASIGFFYCYVRLETSFSMALQLQFQENLHEQVPSEDEARFLSLSWREEKASKPTLTLATFARRLGKRPESVRRSIRFTVLPISVQKLVLPSQSFKKGIAFGLLCELARLQEARVLKNKGYSETELVHLAYVIVTQQKTVKAAGAWVTKQIEELEGQETMFELSIQDGLQDSKRRVASGMEKTMQAGQQHLQMVARMHESGQINRIASDGAVAAVVRTLDVARNMAPKILDGLKGARGVGKARKAVEAVGKRA